MHACTHLWSAAALSARLRYALAAAEAHELRTPVVRAFGSAARLLM